MIAFETESDEDYYEFVDVVSKLDGQLLKPITITVQSTPLTPSPVTPAQYAPILLDFDIHNKYKNKRRIFEGHNIKVSHSMYLDSAFMHFLSGFAIRYTDKYDSLYRLIISDKSFKQLKHSEKIEFIQKKYDINDIIREYSTEEPLPYWFLNSYVDVRRLAIMRKKMLEALHADYKFLEKPRQQELSDMMDFLNIIGASLKGKTNKQKKLEKYKHFLDNL